MTTRARRLLVQDVEVEIVRKDIRNLHLGVYPPAGRVRVAAPLRLSDEAVRLAVISKLGWIRKQRAAFGEQERVSRREVVSGESHYVEGRRYRLRLIERDAAPSVRLRGTTTLEVSVRPGADREDRERILERWYRGRMKAAVPALIEKWAASIGVRPTQWGVRRMKTRWGSCNPDQKRIWLNLELAKKPRACLEYILVHEMVHLRIRHHDDQFREMLTKAMPQWSFHRQQLNRSPLAHEDWTY